MAALVVLGILVAWGYVVLFQRLNDAKATARYFEDKYDTQLTLVANREKRIGELELWAKTIRPRPTAQDLRNSIEAAIDVVNTPVYVPPKRQKKKK